MNFAKAREAAGLTIAEAARKLEITPAAIYQWESGQTFPDAKRLASIAEVYGVTVDYLLRNQEGDSHGSTDA